MAGNSSTWHKLTVKRSILLAILVSATALSAACEQGGAGKGTDGAKLYQNMCATCHGPKGKPDEAMVARLNVRDLTSQELRARITPTLVEQQIRKGSKNKLMPSFEGALNDEQIAALAAYIASPGFLQQ